MKLPEEGMLIRIFIGESDAYHGTPLYQAIVLKAKELLKFITEARGA